MDIQVNWLAVVLATLSSMVVGAIWYARPVFGNMWIKLAKVDMKKNKGVGPAMFVTLVVSFLTAFVLAHVSFLSNKYFGHSFLQDAITTAFWAWLGFTAARFITHDAFEGRPHALTVLNCAHELVTLVIMGVIIGYLPPAL
ncbi:MAG TPA: DUF1761 domain-containing protein [Magnetospirillaceae bacterium]|nr:DUF1761 domain-containing protein [Magnetospirillaceae bacterium]